MRWYVRFGLSRDVEELLAGGSRSQDHHGRARVYPKHPPRHYEFGVDEAATLQVAAAFDELALAI